MAAELLSAIAIVGMLAMLLAAAVGRERAAAEHLADSRAAMRLAERAALALQLHQPIEQAGGAVQVTPLPDAAPAAGFAWMNVRANVNGRVAELIAIVPANGGTSPGGGAR